LQRISVSIINAKSLRAELQDPQAHELRSRIILQLIDNDSGLTPRSKETVRKLLPMYVPLKNNSCLGGLAFFGIVAGAMMISMGALIPAVLGSGIALLGISLILGGVPCVRTVRRGREILRVEKELEDACGGSILMHPLLAGIS
jgi:hypothetical protein